MKQQLEAIRKAALDAISDAGKAEDLEAPVSYTHLRAHET